MISKILFILSSFFCIISCAPGVFENNKGVFSVERKDPVQARQSFLNALLENPGSKVFRYNLSISNIVNEQLKEALNEINALEGLYKKKEIKKSDYDDLFKIYFAKGFLYGLIQKTDDALEYYQKALRIKPDSLKVKQNIELLVQKKRSQKGEDGEPSYEEGEDGEEIGDPDKKGDKDKSAGEQNAEEKTKGEEESLKRKNLTKEEIEQILKEIKNQESKVRAKESQKNRNKKGAGNEKPW